MTTNKFRNWLGGKVLALAMWIIPDVPRCNTCGGKGLVNTKSYGTCVCADCNGTGLV